MAGYIGSKSSVTLVDGYTEAEADAEFVTKTGDSMTGNLSFTAGDITNTISGTYNLNGANGTAGSPAYATYSFKDDPNTGMYRASADNLAFTTAGSQRMKIDASGRVTTPSQPAFQAYSTTNGAFGVNAGDTFPLNATHFNIGNCFNTSNYTFTAPVDGYYQLDFMTISTSSQTNMHLNFVFSGNSNLGYNFHFSGNASGGWDTLTMSGVYYMSAGVSVFVRNNSYGITVHGSTWNKFTGYLLG